MTITKSHKYSFFIVLSTLCSAHISFGMQSSDDLTSTKECIVRSLRDNNCVGALSSLLPKEIHSGSLINFLHGIRAVREKSPQLLQDGADFKKALTKYYRSFFDKTQTALIEDYSNNYLSLAKLKKKIEKNKSKLSSLQSKNAWRTVLIRTAQLCIVGSFFYFSKSAEKFFVLGNALCLAEAFRYRSLCDISALEQSLKTKKQQFYDHGGDIIVAFDNYKDELPTLGFTMPQRPSLPKP